MSTENGVNAGIFSLAHGKAEYYLDCSSIFLDSKKRGSLYYNSESDEQFECVVEKVSIIKKRLDLMGYTFSKCKKIYSDNLKFDDEFMKFDDFFSMLKSVDIREINYTTYEDVLSLPCEAQCDYLEYVKYVSKRDHKLDIDYDSFSDISDAYYHLDRFVVIRLFCEIYCDGDMELSWDILNTIKAKYYTEEEIFHGVDDKYKVTIITEGNTDATVIKKAVENYCSDTKDFYVIVDRQGFPFSSATSMTDLFKGLVKLNNDQRILFLYDNDAAGNLEIKKLKDVEHKSNLMYATLPNLVELENVLFKGPNGHYQGNANGVAVSIECFLDFNPIDNNPTFRIRDYKDKINCYQGVIEQKDLFKKYYNDIGKPNYDSNKLVGLLEYIYSIFCK